MPAVANGVAPIGMIDPPPAAGAAIVGTTDVAKVAHYVSPNAAAGAPNCSS